jgi:aspartate/methionine/tyrosine aminotransferase
MPDSLSSNLAYVTPSQTVAISNEAIRRKTAGEEVYDLSVGEPDFDTPGVVAQAGIQAIQQGKTHYAPNLGIPELKAAVATHLSRLSAGRPINADHIMVSTGSKQALFNACFALFGPKDKVLIPSPAWVSFPQMVHLARAEPILVPGDVEWGLKVSVDDLERQADGLARGLILNSPCNPTGSVYTAKELQAIAEWASSRKIWIIADEIYRRIHYGSGPAPSLLDLPDELLERVVITYGASKAHAMTGWRIGVALGPPHVIKAMGAIQSHTTTGANHPSQWAAVTAFSDERAEQEVGTMVAGFARRREYLVNRFRTEVSGIEFVEPHGAFYLFFRVDGFSGPEQNGKMFCERLMEEHGIALVPGAAFGDDRWVRLSYAVSDQDLAAALDKMIPFMQALTGSRAT